MSPGSSGPASHERLRFGEDGRLAPGIDEGFGGLCGRDLAGNVNAVYSPAARRSSGLRRISARAGRGFEIAPAECESSGGGNQPSPSPRWGWDGVEA